MIRFFSILLLFSFVAVAAPRNKSTSRCDCRLSGMNADSLGDNRSPEGSAYDLAGESPVRDFDPDEWDPLASESDRAEDHGCY